LCTAALSSADVETAHLLAEIAFWSIFVLQPSYFQILIYNEELSPETHLSPPHLITLEIYCICRLEMHTFSNQLQVIEMALLASCRTTEISAMTDLLVGWLHGAVYVFSDLERLCKECKLSTLYFQALLSFNNMEKVSSLT